MEKAAKYYKVIGDSLDLIGVATEVNGRVTMVSKNSISTFVEELPIDCEETTQNFFYNYYKQTIKVIKNEVSQARNSKTKI